MKSATLIGLIVSVTSCLLFGQKPYWQQHVSYKMEIDMNVESHQFIGNQQLTYTNNSPDTLHRVFYHLYFNAFQPGSMMDVRSRTIADPDGRVMDRISKLSPEEIGYLKIETLKQDDTPLTFHTSGTILEVDLARQILPGQTTTFHMTFNGQVPIQIRRSGRDSAEGVAYSMAQWYPKLSEYDHRGWHPNPYVAREFHGVWGDFEVTLHIDKDYTVAATGYLQNPDEVGHGYSDEKGKSRKGKLTWHFKASNVHDFMWAADTDYRHLIYPMEDGPSLHFFYIPDSATVNWGSLPEYTSRAFSYMNKHYGKYPHEKYSVVQGGDGGMEYPMATLITGERSLRSLVGVTVHELVHSWYQGALANNESLYSWMDEGFTEFVSEEIMEYLFHENIQPHPQISHFKSYFNLVNSGKQEPLTTHADHFNLNAVYSISSYIKGSIFLRQLNYIIGEDNFRKGMLRYFNEWKFKHPEPNDFIRVMEKQSGMELSWYLEYWVNSIKTIDYGVQSVTQQGDSSRIILERTGDMIMPLDVKIRLSNGTDHTYSIPLRIMRGHKPLLDGMSIAEPWPWTNPEYSLVIPVATQDIVSVEIDPDQQTADVNRKNNVLEPGDDRL
jgi:hypothetical protein